MQKIDKTKANILSTKYKSWIDKLINNNESRDGNYRYYYDDVAMNLYRCQKGVCAFTEMYICIPELYKKINWIKGRYKEPITGEVNRKDHFGELDHFNAENKAVQYWNWDNLFMIHSKINSIKTNKIAIGYLKPDLDDYSPEKYFEYDDKTNRFIPNTAITDVNERNEIQYMIDEVLYLNHGVVRNERKNYINMIKDKKAKGESYKIDRFFTSVRWVVGD